MSKSAERAARNYIRQQLGIDYSIVVVGSSAGVIQDPNIPGNVLVRIKASNGFMLPFSVGKPVSKVPLTVGKAVELEYKRKKLRIAGLDNDGIITSGGDPLADTNDTDFNKQESLATLAVTQTQPASTTVKVKGWNPIVNGTAYEFPGGEIDIATANGGSSYIPSSGNMAYIVIFVKNDYLTLEAKSSTARSLADVDLNIDDINEAIALRTAGSTPVWAIPLSNGQTTITQNDILNGRDLRNLVNNLETAGTTGNVTGPGSSTDRAIATWNGTAGTTLRNNANATIDASGNLTAASLISNGNITQIVATKSGIYTHANTDTRTYTFPDATGNVILDTATQNLSNKTITASTLNSTPIGGSSPSTGAFTTLSATGTLSVAFTTAGASQRAANLQATISTNNSGNVGALGRITTNNSTPVLTNTLTSAPAAMWAFSDIGGSNAIAEIQSLKVSISKAGSNTLALWKGISIESPSIAAGGITNVVAIFIDDQTSGGTSNAAITTNAGNITFNEGGNASTIFRVEGDTDANLIYTDAANDRLGIGTSTPSTKAHALLSSAATNAITNVLTVGHNSTGTAAAGFGTGLIFEAESSTTNNTSLGRLRYEWSTATHASRKAKGYLSAFDTAERDCLAWEASGTAPMLGLFAVAPIARPTNAIAAAAFVANTSGIANDTATFGGYTLGQIAQALINLGALT